MSIKTSYTINEAANMTGETPISLWRLIKRDKIPHRRVKCRGGYRIEVDIQNWPSNIQEAIVLNNNKEGESSPAALARTIETLPMLSPGAALKAAEMITGGSDFDSMFPDFATTALVPQSREQKKAYYDQAGPELAVMMKPRVQRICRIVEDALACPPGYKSRAWAELVAEKHGTTFQSVYRYVDRYNKKGLVGLDHTKSTKGQATAWTPEALDHWLGLCLKREHRKINKQELYNNLVIEAARRGWRIGCKESAYQHYRERSNYLLEAYQRGGARALDNALPPILRDYSDLAPFECLVGDQHRKNRWVVDDSTGDVIRIEAYVWQDLRTRVIYGGACARHYDAYIMGLALRMGLLTFGTFGSVYTDNGKPELSMYFNGILANIRAYGMDWGETIDFPVDLLDVDPEEVYPAGPDPKLHRLAIVKNAKAKMIEGTWHTLDDIMTSVCKLPGDSKKLCDDMHYQDVDQAELKRLRDSGKLPLMSQYIIAFYQALDYCNKEKPHRGVKKEWRWNVAPASGKYTPFDCLRACCEEGGWRPRTISDRAIDLLFMRKEKRIINRGHILAFNDTYVADELLTLHKERVDIRYDLVDQENLLVFHQGQYLCTAHPIEYSSMKDMDLAKRKIMEKRRKAKEITELYSRLTKPISDIRMYGSAAQIEQVAALVAEAQERKRLEYHPPEKELTQAELNAEVAKLEQGLPLPAKTVRPLPVRPGYFLNDEAHFEWIVAYLKAGGVLDSGEEAFKDKHLAGMNAGQREYYEFVMNEYAGG